MFSNLWLISPFNRKIYQKLGTLHINILGHTCVITLKILNHEDLKILDMKYFLYHESYNTKNRRPLYVLSMYMYQKHLWCTCKQKYICPRPLPYTLTSYCTEKYIFVMDTHIKTLNFSCFFSTLMLVSSVHDHCASLVTTNEWRYFLIR